MPDSELERNTALAEAEEMRQYRAWLLGEVASGAIDVDGLIEQRELNRQFGPVKVVVVAEKVPGVGKVRARRSMEKLGIPEDARCGEVSDATLRALWLDMAEAATRPLR